MNAFRAKGVRGGQFDFDGNDLTDAGRGKRAITGPPCNHKPVTADVFGVGRVAHPHWGGDITPEPDFYSRTFAPIDLSHADDIANLPFPAAANNIVNGLYSVVCEGY